ncbi:hypothetical protein B0H11DRAFT_1874845 [Mycena galericulata]|nr:hypothetical protein B0H11DRAFT_1874845 [Mycena galericulata]
MRFIHQIHITDIKSRSLPSFYRFQPVGPPLPIHHRFSPALSKSLSSNRLRPEHRPLQAPVTGARDKTIKLWDTASGQLLRNLPGHDNWVRALAFHPSGKFLLSASEDKTISARGLILLRLSAITPT